MNVSEWVHTKKIVIRCMLPVSAMGDTYRIVDMKGFISAMMDLPYAEKVEASSGRMYDITLDWSYPRPRYTREELEAMAAEAFEYYLVEVSDE